jgi:hypothetical protein
MAGLKAKWYYDGRTDPWAGGEPLTSDWIIFNEAENYRIELAQTQGRSEIDLGKYTVDLINRIQYMNSDKTKQRLVKRIAANETDSTSIQERFNYPSRPEVKTFTKTGVSMSPFIQEWTRRNPYALYKSDIGRKIVDGLMNEVNLTQEKKDKLKTLFTDVDNLPISKLKERSIEAYTRNDLFGLVNETLRDNDLSKVDTLGPFCSFLNRIVSEPIQSKTPTKPKDKLNSSSESDDDPIDFLYRSSELTEEAVEEYKKCVGQTRSWLGFSSTTRQFSVAQFLSRNTIFIIEVAAETAPVFPGKFIAEISHFKEEDEVLLQAGIDFRIEKVEEKLITEGKKQHIIHLTLL